MDVGKRFWGSLNSADRRQMPPSFSDLGAVKSLTSNQCTTSDFSQNSEYNAASGGGFNHLCHDFPATKRRKLNGNQSSIACEAYTSQQEQLFWPQQTFLPPQFSHFSHQSRAEEGAIQTISNGYNSLNEAQYHEKLQNGPGVEIENNHFTGLEIFASEKGLQSPSQSIVKHHCGPSEIPRRLELQNSGQSFDLQQEGLESTIENLDAEESGRPVATAVAETCYGMVS